MALRKIAHSWDSQIKTRHDQNKDSTTKIRQSRPKSIATLDEPLR